MTKYITKDSGQRQEFDSGSVRDTQEGKPRYDLIPPAPLKRLAELYGRGAEKYGEHNWTKGQPVSRFQASLERHLEQWIAGDTDEDHLAAVVWNTMAIMHFEDTDWNDKFDWTPVNRPTVDIVDTEELYPNVKFAQYKCIICGFTDDVMSNNHGDMPIAWPCKKCPQSNPGYMYPKVSQLEDEGDR